MPFSLSPLALSKTQRELVVSDYFRHAGYHVDPESRLVSTASGHNKYSITGKENPIKVASQFGLKPQLLTNLSDPLFSHQVIKGQVGFCSAFSNILSETPADNVSEVVNRCLETLDSMDSVFVSNKSALQRFMTATYSASRFDKLKEKATAFRYNDDAKEQLFNHWVRVLDASGLIDYSSIKFEPNVDHSAKLSAMQERFVNYVVSSAKSHVNHEAPPYTFVVNVMHAAAKHGFEISNQRDNDIKRDTMQRFSLGANVDKVLRNIYDCVKGNRLNNAASHAESLRLGYDDAIDQINLPMAPLIRHAEAMQEILTESGYNSITSRLKDGELSPYDGDWLAQFSDVLIADKAGRQLDDEYLKNMIKLIPKGASDRKVVVGRKEDEFMKQKKELNKVVLFLNGVMDNWRGTEVEGIVDAFKSAVAEFDPASKTRSPFDALHGAIVDQINQRVEKYTLADVKEASLRAQNDAGWKQVVVNAHKVSRVKNIRDIGELFGVLVATDVMAMSVEAGILRPVAASDVIDHPGVERSDEREVDVVVPEAANDRVVEPAQDLPPVEDATVRRVAELEEVGELIRDAMWRGDTLLLEDENDWFEMRWEQCLNIENAEDKVRAIEDVFGDVLNAPNKKAIKKWYLEDADHDFHAKRLQDEVKLIVDEWGSVPGVTELMNHHLSCLEAAPGIVSRKHSVSAISMAADALSESKVKLKKLSNEQVQSLVAAIKEQISSLAFPVSISAMPWLDMEKAGELDAAVELTQCDDAYPLLSRFSEVKVGETVPSLPIKSNVSDEKVDSDELKVTKRLA